ncbi:4-hydroxy-3-methylbut-2-enyl diphosphate reductase [bacterium]|nr:4-hydroxy-3-methylbut-2-enyl diphosphate reductase [bacterium]
MKKFDIPAFYRSSVITSIKEYRREQDTRKKDFSPTRLDFGPIVFLIARHFGFCYGVENAIEISYKAISENPNKRIFLLSEMIHNPEVNQDLQSRGVRFIMHTSGQQLIPWETLTPNDVVLVPAFGTTVEIERRLAEIGIQSYTYDTTCPFVEKVWNKASAIGKERYSVIIHGKPTHEETRATFSHSRMNAPTMVLRDMAEAKKLGGILLGEVPKNEFYHIFKNQISEGFDVDKDLQRIGVVNQTTMLASDTQAIADYLREIMIRRYELNETNIHKHFSDTGDTLCYATNDNQNATYGLLKETADFAIVAGGYNSSNTSHIVELCEQKLPTYLISSQGKIISKHRIDHFDYHKKAELTTDNFMPNKNRITVMLTSGASCPDSVVEEILNKLLSFFDEAKNISEVLKSLTGLSQNR